MRTLVLLSLVLFAASALYGAELRAGVAKVDITDRAAGPVNDPYFAEALVLKSEGTTVVLLTIDAVAIGYIYYTPTVERRGNIGYAQEDGDTLVAPEWQRTFEAKVVEVLKGL